MKRIDQPATSKSFFTPWRRFGLFFLFFIVSLFSDAKKVSSDWTVNARRLTGESDRIAENALKNLRATSDLDILLKGELKNASVTNGKLNTAHFFAFDVISALHKKQLMPDLIASSKADQTGYAYHAMNTLIDAANGQSLIQIYHDRLTSNKMTIPVQLALLDTLGRVEHKLSLDELKEINAKASTEMKSGLLNYLREMMILKNHPEYKEFLPPFLKEPSFEIKMQALFLFDELLKQKKMRFSGDVSTCLVDPNMTIQNFCKRVVMRNLK